MKLAILFPHNPLAAWLTPRGLALRGGALIALYAIAILCGLRTYSSVVCGNPTPLLGSLEHGGLLGAGFMLLHIAATVFAPILLLAALILALTAHRKGEKA